MPNSVVGRRGLLITDGWAGRSYQQVIIEGETPKRYRVRAVEDLLRLPSRGKGERIVLLRSTVLVPKHAVRVSARAPEPPAGTPQEEA